MKAGGTTVALVGIGGYGDVYLRSLLNPGDRAVTFVGGVDPVALKSVRVDEVQRRNIPIFPSMEALYERVTPDLVVLASPLHLHAEQACFAMERGSHVLCEKPLAATPHDALRMIATRDATRRILAVGFQWAYSPGVRRLKQDIMNDRFGRPTRFHTRVYWPRDKAYYSRNSWAGKLATADGRPVLDSPVNNACAHYIQNMLYLLGESQNEADWPRTVTAELYRANDIQNYDTSVIRAGTCRGVEMLVAVSHATEGAVDPSFEFAFENAVVTSGGVDGNRIVATLPNGEKIDYGIQPMGDNVDKMWDTIDSIRTGAPPACGAEAAASHTALMYAAQQSGRPVPFPPQDIQVTGAAGAAIVSVRGLDAVLDRCYGEFKLPAELGVSWALPGKTIHVEGLTRFEPKSSGS